MDVAKLGQRQLFLMKWENLEKRIIKRYEQSQNVLEVVEYLVAVLVRSAICSRTISETLQALMRELFLTSEPNDMLRRYAPYFEEYCKNDWETIRNRLFSNEADYLACTKEARAYKDYLTEEATLDIRQADHTYIVESFFEDINGKRHKLTIRETDPNKTRIVIANILQILTTLTIFETNGVRKFVKFINYEGSGKISTTSYDTRVEIAEESGQVLMEEAASTEETSGEALAFNNTNTGGAPKKSVDSNRNAPEEALLTKQTTAPQKDGSVMKSATATSSEKKAKKSAAISQKSDTTYMRYGKTAEQIEEEREKRRIERRKKNYLQKRKK
ncbi:hypothetical protein [Candidatus Enterococcus murrayae]|uniref:DUF4194 domain-containing protein n=1 Tax=Candidatus Enterococcus murrayae TaxID=2815321 RepID=A0ABS3HL29_9ENTE|nr:hypothetical protein [Enterococcus sp. MJM16]MBO0454151.1 hypothetical protein [Enterococcus sp. MJM16]